MKGKYDTIVVTVDGLVGTTNHHYDVPTRIHVGHVGWPGHATPACPVKGFQAVQKPSKGCGGRS